MLPSESFAVYLCAEIDLWLSDGQCLMHQCILSSVTTKMPSHESPSLETDNVIAAVSQLGIGGNSPSVDAEFDGGECRIFKLSFRDQEDSSSIAVRVQHPAGGGGNHDGTTAALRTEARVLRSLEARPQGASPGPRGAEGRALPPTTRSGTRSSC